MRFPATQARHYAAILCLILFLHVPDSARAATDARTPYGLGAVVTKVLPNGLKAVIAPSRAADLVTIDAWVGAGTRRETAETNGAAHFMEHLLFKGTAKRKAGEIDAAIEDLGGSLNASTSYDWAHFYVTVGSADAESTLAILSDALMNAELRQEDMDRERPVILSEMAREMTSPSRRVMRVVDRMMFPAHPYGRPLLGTPDSITNMPRQTVVDFYNTYYVPDNVAIVISGKITPGQAAGMVERAFGNWRGHPSPADKTLPSEPPADVEVRNLTGPVSTGYCTLGFRAPSVSDQPDSYVMDVLLTILGQGGNNRLEQDLQKKQKLVTNIGANYLTQRDPGILTVSASFDPPDLDAVRAGILTEIDALRETRVTDAELAAAKHTLLASYLFDVQTSSGRADALGFYSIINTCQYDIDYIANFESVTAEQVQSAAKKYLDTKAYVFVTLLPKPDPVTASRQ